MRKTGAQAVKPKSEILEMAVELATGLHQVGAMDRATLREIKELAEKKPRRKKVALR